MSCPDCINAPSLGTPWAEYAAVGWLVAVCHLRHCRGAGEVDGGSFLGAGATGRADAMAGWRASARVWRRGCADVGEAVGRGRAAWATATAERHVERRVLSGRGFASGHVERQGLRGFR